MLHGGWMRNAGKTASIASRTRRCSDGSYQSVDEFSVIEVGGHHSGLGFVVLCPVWVPCLDHGGAVVVRL